MSNQLVPSNQNAVTQYGGDPFEEFAKENAPRYIIGTTLKCSKGDWLAGKEKTLVPVGTPLVAIMSELYQGWIRWSDKKPAEQIMQRVADGLRLPGRDQLGYGYQAGDDEPYDTSAWEVGDDGKPVDPWQFALYLPMVDLAAGKVYTFTGGRTAKRPIGALNWPYSMHRRKHPDEYPLVHLSINRYNHPTFGVIKYPDLVPIKKDGWVKFSEFSHLLEAEGLGGWENDDGKEIVEDSKGIATDNGAPFNDDIPY